VSAELGDEPGDEWGYERPQLVFDERLERLLRRGHQPSLRIDKGPREAVERHGASETRGPADQARCASSVVAATRVAAPRAELVR
jgi:hypothetical protein